MFDGVRYWLQMRQLIARRNALRAVNRKRYLANKVADDQEQIAAEMHSHDLIDDEMADIQNRRIIWQAQDYLIEIPPFTLNGTINPDWMQSTIGEGYRLIPVALSKLRREVRAEQRDLRDAWSRWVPVAFGLIGSLYGLITLLK